jgi:hypothetical protein
MSNFGFIGRISQSIRELIQKIVNYISGGTTRIFTPTDDNYPETGVQPFEGDITR